jgi:hypothetical protein
MYATATASKKYSLAGHGKTIGFLSEEVRAK